MSLCSALGPKFAASSRGSTWLSPPPRTALKPVAHVVQIVSQHVGQDCEVSRGLCGSSSVCTRLQLQGQRLDSTELLGKYFVVHNFSACCITSYKSLAHLETTMALHQGDVEESSMSKQTGYL